MRTNAVTPEPWESYMLYLSAYQRWGNTKEREEEHNTGRITEKSGNISNATLKNGSFGPENQLDAGSI